MTPFLRKSFASIVVAIGIIAVQDASLSARNADWARTVTPQKKKRAVPPKSSTPEPAVDMDKQFPLHAGNYWLYKASVEVGNDHGSTTKSGTPKRIQVISAKNDGKQTVVKLKNEDYNGSRLTTYVIRGRRIYEFDEFDGPDWETQRDLSVEKLRFVFPMSINQEWGDLEERPVNTAGM